MRDHRDDEAAARRNRPAAQPGAGAARNDRLAALEGDAHGERGLASVARDHGSAGKMPFAVRVVRIDGEVFRGAPHGVRAERFQEA